MLPRVPKPGERVKGPLCPDTSPLLGARNLRRFTKVYGDGFQLRELCAACSEYGTLISGRDLAAQACHTARRTLGWASSEVVQPGWLNDASRLVTVTARSGLLGTRLTTATAESPANAEAPSLAASQEFPARSAPVSLAVARTIVESRRTPASFTLHVGPVIPTAAGG